MATEAVRDITEGVNLTARGREAHEGSKINPRGYIAYSRGAMGSVADLHTGKPGHLPGHQTEV